LPPSRIFHSSRPYRSAVGISQSKLEKNGRNAHFQSA
jgi:hypothetical protein